jgi:Tfp pilus assembly protein PilP
VKKKKRLLGHKVKHLNSTRSKLILCLISIICCLLVFNCGGDVTPPPIQPKARTPGAAKKKVEPVQVPGNTEKKELSEKAEIEYTYDPVGKPDPFKPFIQLSSKEIPKGLRLTPLQKYDISQLKLVAIIIAPEGNIALVEDSTGKGYFVRKGTLIGKNDGKVKKILLDKVIIEEVYQDVVGQTKVNEVSLFLHRPEEGGES